MSIIDNTAIGSWSGFVYQGLCALYHCLRLIESSLGGICPDYFLNLDSFEDFSILDANDDIVSMHQCKNEKKVKNYTDEFNKMVDKKNASPKAIHAILYFHTNKNVNVNSPIIAYQFTSTATFCTSNDLIQLIEALVKKLACCDEATCQKKSASLYKLIDDRVLQIHQMSFGLDYPLRDIARRDRIPLQDIYEIVHREEKIILLDKSSIVQYARIWLINDLLEFLQFEEDDILEKKINETVTNIQRFDDDSFFDFLTRLHPRQNFNQRDVRLLANIINEDTNSSVYEVVSKTPKLNDELNWISPKKETPAAFSRSMRPELICSKIYENAPNLNVLYEYDWLVGDIQKTVQDVCNQYSIFNYVQKNESNIFHQKKVGLLSIEDKINGNY